MKNFAITGVAGFIAPRHLRAIEETGNNLFAALDPHDSAGILDESFSDSHFFLEPELFEKFIESHQLNAINYESRVHYNSIYTHNYLNDPQIRMA